MPPDVRYMADTNAVSYIITRHPLAARYAHLFADEAAIGISFQALAELRVGLRMLDWDRRRFDAVMSRFVEVPLSSRAEQIWVDVRADSIARHRDEGGRAISAADAWIAATAMAIPCPLITHDVRDFRRIRGLELAPGADEGGRD